MMYFMGMKNEKVNPCRQATYRYLVEMGLSMVVYVAVMWASRWFLWDSHVHVGRQWQVVIALSPILPVLLMFAVIVRFMMQMDELMRRIHVNALALSGGATALLAAGYGMIEGSFGLPILSAWWTYSVFMLGWLVAGFFVQRRYR
jgi:hypothetical protein